MGVGRRRAGSSAAARAAGPGGMRCLRRCGARGRERGHRGGFEGGDVAVVADHGAGAVGASRWRAITIPVAGGDVEDRGAEPVGSRSTVAPASSGGTE